MPLTVGTRLGSYEIVEPLGAGGMGEVYRGRDTKLGRDVALKILPGMFASDPDRLARFEREARTLAALNHPHIAQIHGLEESGGQRVLVMELVEGEDLAQRLTRGAIPGDEALPIARQIAEALAAAHDADIVHRDLKPANIKLRDDGTVKVLDFGLAKAVERGPGSGHELGNDPSKSPTITTPAMTVRGTILGTAAYMAPEQARGRPVDKRADIWAFGCVVYEMLTGRQAFDGETVSDVLAAVLTREPDLTALPVATPAEVRRVIERCLRKDASRRYHDIADARIELDEAGTAPPAAAPAPTRERVAWLPTVAISIIAAAAGSAGAWALLSRPEPPPRRYSFTIRDAGFNTVSSTAISHDGRWIVYSPNVNAAPFKLFIRSLESFETRELASSTTTTGFNPFFSPDDDWVGFFMAGTLYKVAVSGGAPQRIAAIDPANSSGVWTRDGAIIVSNSVLAQNVRRRRLAKLSADGGDFVPLTTPASNEAHLSPEVTPDGRSVLFTLATEGASSIAVVPLDGGAPRIIVNDARTPRYSSTGHLLYQQSSSGDLMTVAFDPTRLEATGEASRIARAASLISGATFAVAANGVLIYSAPEDTSEQSGFTIVAVDRAGVETPLLSAPGTWATPRVSPDGRTVLYRSIDSPACDLWALDVTRSTRSRVTLEGDNHDPVWRPDGRVTWSSVSTGVRGIRLGRPDRPGDVVALAESATERMPESWSPDGKQLLFVEIHQTNGRDLWLLNADSGVVRPFAVTRFNEDSAAFSPDGTWVAYVSNESGRNEVYLQRTDGEGGRIGISADGGAGPVWSPDGRELFYAEGEQLMQVDIDNRTSSPQASRPKMLLRGPYVWERAGNYDITPDGRRFIFVRRAEGIDPSATLRVVVNWPPQPDQENR